MDLIDAAKNGNLESVLTLLECGYAANTRDKDNATALYWSACHGHIDVTEIIISAGCDVNSSVRWGSTALHAAADRGHVQCVQILINSGANPNSTNNRGDTPLHIASYRGFMEITRLLLLAGSNVNLRNEKGKIPQEEAMEGGNSDIAECIRVFVTEGHFSLPNEAQQSSVTMRNNNARNRQAYDNSHLQNLATFRLGSRDSVTSDDSSDISESMTSSMFTSGSSFPEDIVDAGVVHELRSTPAAHAIKRSVSFGGSSTHYSNRNAALPQPMFQTPTRISSAEDIHRQEQGVGHMIRNDGVIMRYSTYNCAQIERPYVLDSNEHQNGTLNNRVPINTTRPLSSTKQVTCSATESIDLSHVGNAPFLGLNTTNGLNGARQLRSSIGTMREIARYDHKESLTILQNQLVESYKHIEVLTKENEHLKFKSSTLLERLTVTERQLSEMTMKCESLANNLENGKHTMPGLENQHSMVKDRPILDNCVSIQGFEELAKRFEDKPTELHERLKETVEALALKIFHNRKEMDKEWLPGVDYVILGDPPISAPVDEHIPKFVSFLVKHLKTNKCFILKMMIELQTPEAITNVSLRTKSKETDTQATQLQLRPNLMKVLHQFEAPTERLKKFVYIPSPRDSNLPQQKLTDRTTFIVTPYMLTLRKLINMCYNGQLVSTDNGINTVFWLHILYQLSSVLCLVENRGESLVDIGEDTVGFDDELVPYFKNIENVIDICLCSKTGNRPVLKSCSLLTEEKRDAMDAFCDTKSETMTAITKLCKLFHEVLCDSNTGNRPLVIPTRQNEHVTPLAPIQTAFCRILADAKEPMSFLFKESNTAINISKRFGFLLFGPDCDSITKKTECFLYHQSRMLKLLTEIPACKRSTNQDGVYLTIEESVVNNNTSIKAHYFCHVNPHELWSLYQTFEQNGLLVK